LPDGFSQSYFIDSESFLLVAQRHVAPFHAFGDPVKTETRFSDFRKIGGVVFAFNSGQYDISSGKLLNEIQWMTIKVNDNVPYKWFLPPVYERTILQNYLEQLYQERSDSVAIKWTFNNFNRFHPDVNTEQGIEFIGYQILKMGEEKNALLLLKLNQNMFPKSAVAAFGVGRAYNTLGDKANARTEFKKSLALDPNYKRSQDALKSIEAN